MALGKEPSSRARKPLSPLALLGILAFGFILIHKMGNKHRKKPDHHGRANRDPKPTDHCKFDASLIHPTPIQPRTEDEQWKTDQKGFWKRQLALAKVLNWLTGIAAGGAIVYGLVAFFQWRDAHKNFEDAHRNFQLDERPWVGVKEVAFKMIPRPIIGHPTEKAYILNATLNASNSGKTPAFNVGVDGTLKTFDTLPDIDRYARSNRRERPAGPPSYGTFFPGDKQDVGATPTTALTSDAVEGIRHGTKYLYVFGEITYRDSFGSSHFTHYCYHFDTFAQGLVDCSAYNDAN